MKKAGIVVVPSSMDLSATLIAPPLYCNVGDQITFDVKVLVSAEDAQHIDFNNNDSTVSRCGSLFSAFQYENQEIGLYPKQLTADQINSFITSMGLDPSQNAYSLSLSFTDGNALINADSDPTAILYASPAPYLPVAQNVGTEDVHFTGTFYTKGTMLKESPKTINVTLPIVVSAAVDNQTPASGQ